MNKDEKKNEWGWKGGSIGQDEKDRVNENEKENVKARMNYDEKEGWILAGLMNENA